MKTIIEFKNVKVNKGFKDKMFSIPDNQDIITRRTPPICHIVEGGIMWHVYYVVPTQDVTYYYYEKCHIVRFKHIFSG